MSEDRKKKDAFFWLGWFMAFVVAGDIFVNLGDWYEVLWFCPVAAAAASFALFRRHSLLLTMTLVLAVPAQTPWVLDFFLHLSGPGWGRTALLAECGPVIFWGSLVTHSAVIPVAAWGVWKLGFHPKALWPSLGCTVTLLTLSFLISPFDKNINCVFYGCDGIITENHYLRYFLIRTLLVWLLVVPVSFFVLRWIYSRLPKARDNAHNA